MKMFETVPGLLALIGVVGSYVRMGQRVDVLEDEVKAVSPLKDQVTRIDERTKGMDKRSERIEDKLDRLMENLPYRRDFPRSVAMHPQRVDGED